MNERKCRQLVHARSHGLCEMCGGVAHHVHHRKNRSQGGQWSPENCLHLCVFDHHFVTVNPAESVKNGWSVRSHQDPATSPVWLARHEWALLDDNGGFVAVTDIPDEESA
jgi:hypothetical protein